MEEVLRMRGGFDAGALIESLTCESLQPPIVFILHHRYATTPC